MKLRCIADDFTGATDLANNLDRAGMRTVQTIGVADGAAPAGAEAVVVALKSRTIPAGEAVAQSLAALHWLRRHGAQQIYFKVCSTFDSTDRGNIGPVTEALMDAPGLRLHQRLPGLPGQRPHGLQGLPLHRRRAARRGQHARPPSDAGLHAMRRAFASLTVLTAGSGVAIGLPANFGLAPGGDAAQLPPSAGACAIVSGSCSAASNAQAAAFLERHPQRGFAVDPLRIAAGEDVAGGETSAACVKALGIRQLRIGGQIDPGVPWCHAVTDAGRPLHLALKSGNFGTSDFFDKAFEVLLP